MENDLAVAVFLDGLETESFRSWHRSDCPVLATVEQDIGPCSLSTRLSETDTDYLESELKGGISRWYVDESIG